MIVGGIGDGLVALLGGASTPPLEAAMSEVLVYQTSDPRFADLAIEAMTQAGIPCFKTGQGYVEMIPAAVRDLGNGICIYIRDPSDTQRANSILVGLGAAIETPPRRPSQRVIFLIAVILAVIAIYVATQWK